MKKEDLLKAFGEIDDRFIEEAMIETEELPSTAAEKSGKETGKQPEIILFHNRFVRVGSLIAACFVLLLCIRVYQITQKTSKSEDAVVSSEEKTDAGAQNQAEPKADEAAGTAPEKKAENEAVKCRALI